MPTNVSHPDFERISSKSLEKALVTSSMKLGEAIYKAEAASAEEGMAEGGPEGDAADGPDAGPEETIVDADFEEVDDDDDDRKDQSSAS